MMISPVADAKPRLYARPYPRTGSRITSAPNDRATSDVRSVDPLSTTITWSTKSGIRRNTCSIPCSSFRQGVITVILCDLYTLGLRAGPKCLKVPRRRWYHILMKLFCALTALAAAAFASVNPQLHQVKRVYILAMSSSMDQYLANQLATSGIFEVVTDPMKADAIFTDHVGEAFQKKLDDLYPPPTPPKTPPEATKPAADTGANLDVGESTVPDPKAAKGGLGDVDFGGP